MIWNNAATWVNTLIWINTDDLGVSVETEVVKTRVKSIPNTVGLIRSLVPVEKVSYVSITGDVELIGLLPDRVYLDKIIAVESNGMTGQISAGTSAGGFELFTSISIAGSDGTMINVGRYTAISPSIFLHHTGAGDDWNGMSIDIYLLYWKL